MARHSSQGKQGFIWLPKEGITVYKIYVNSEDVTNLIMSAEFTKGVIPEIGSFRVTLINADSYFTNRYTKGQTVEMYIDYVDGTTKRFTGYIDKIGNSYNEIGYGLEVSGSHVTVGLVEKKVVGSYQGYQIGDILNDITSKFLVGYTINNLTTYTDLIYVNWDEVPFIDALHELCKVANADAYVTDDLVITLIDRESVINENEAVVWNDTLIDCSGLGTQDITVRNRVKVYGDDGSGLPVIYHYNNLTSQAITRIKEEVIFDTNITNTNQAIEVGHAEITYNDVSDELEGECEALIMPSLTPGDMIWIIDPVMKIHQLSRAYKFTHKFYDEHTILSIGTERKLTQVMKNRMDNEIAIRPITNPFQMTESWNMTFDDEVGISKDSNVQVKNGKISLSSGSGGTFSIAHTFSTAISQVYLKAVGSNLTFTLFELSIDGGNTYSDLTLEELGLLSSSTESVILRVTFQNANTEIDSLALLAK